MADAVLAGDVGRLSTLTSTGGADEDHSGGLAGGRGGEGGGDGGDGVGDGGGGRLFELRDLVLELGAKVSVRDLKMRGGKRQDGPERQGSSSIRLQCCQTL